jgi:L-cysteine:1D-myo-inositol 2-amino-2-deoxy-alpha-D-glucopyranoside ligase
MPRAAARLEQWLATDTRAGSASPVLDEVRVRLDDDLDTSGAVAAIDAAAQRGEPVGDATALLGVFLTGEPIV